MPAAFMESSSLCSPKLPKVIIEAKRVERGMVYGSVVADPHPRNSRITHILRPFPTRSSMYIHRNCITKINAVTKKVMRNGPKNDLSMKRSSFFIITAELQVLLIFQMQRRVHQHSFYRQL